MELTLLSRFFNAAKADDCGSSMRMPYMHLYRYGYLSGSRSWSLKSSSTIHVSKCDTACCLSDRGRGARTCEDRGLNQLHQLVDLNQEVDGHVQFATVCCQCLGCDMSGVASTVSTHKI